MKRRPTPHDYAFKYVNNKTIIMHKGLYNDTLNQLGNSIQIK